MTMTAEALAKLAPDEKRRLLAELLKRKQLGTAAGLSERVHVDRHAVFALNDMQQAFWIGRSGAVQLGNIGIHGYLEIECSDLDVARAGQAFCQLIARHDMLRAIVLPDGTQRVLTDIAPFEIAFEDLAAVADTQRQARLLELREHLSHQVFDVQRWPLFDIRAAKLDARTTLLFFSIDLIIADTRSVLILFREWAEFYRQPQRAPAPLSYSFQQYTADEPALAETESYRRAEAYWTERLAQLPDAPQLPLRVAPSSIAEPRFVRHAAVLDAARWSRLKELGQRYGLTPSVLMCTAYVEILERWSGQQHFTLNVIPSVRRPVHPEINDVMGPFSAIDLLEIDLRPCASFVERARALQARLYEDLDHIHYNGVKVLRKLAQRRGSGLSALMPIVFTSTMLDLRDLEGLGRIRHMLTQTPQVWIDHQLAEREGALLFNWDVVEELFPQGMLAEMFGAFAQRVHALADDPHAFESCELQALSETGRAARQRANDTSAPLRELTLHEVIWERARQSPEREAVICSTRRLSYGELRYEAEQLSLRLRSHGARPNKLVAVSLNKGWQQVVAVLGVLEAGAAYLPLDPGLPIARRLLLLERAGCDLIVSSAECSRELPDAWQGRVLTLEPVAGASGVVADPFATDAAEAARATAADLAYVIFTSGSTGTPKGVMMSHRAVLNTLDDINQRFGVGPDDRVLGLSSLSFDLSVYDLFGVLSNGGCVVLPEAGSEREPAHWLELMQREHVTIWNSVPALLRMLVEHAAGQETLAALRLVLLSGDWIPVTLPEQTRALAPAARVIGLGGATEAGIWSIHQPIESVAHEWTSIPYGKPLRNQRFHVRDGQLRDCPTWVTGELYIAGAGLADGYFGDPERTAASFVTDPRSGERLYRSGDLGRYLPDGTIEFLGRTDAQVKVAGHRIELEEIEAHLARHPMLRASAVRAIGDRHDKRLVAYVVLAAVADAPGAVGVRSRTELEARMRVLLRDYLAQSLPDYMVPRHIVFLDALPLTANGKLDTANLPAPSLDENAAQLDGRAAVTQTHGARAELERVIVQVWEAVLQRNSIGVTANFFDLGGDSLRMVRVRRLLLEKLARELTMVELYAHPSPSLLARHLAQQHSGVADAAPPSSSAPVSAGKSRAARRQRALAGTDGAR
jgi:pyochelin synthetase